MLASAQAQAFNELTQGPSQAGQRVLHFGWNAGIDPARHDSVPLQVAKYVGQYFLEIPSTDLRN